MPNLIRSTRLWTPVAAVCLAFFAIVALAPQAAAQSRTARVAGLLLQFEVALMWDAVSDDWPNQRDQWIADVHAAKTPGDVAQQVMALEGAIGWDYVADTWKDRRDGWIAEMQAATTDAAVAAGLLELEQVASWSAVDDTWAASRDRWVAALSAIH